MKVTKVDNFTVEVTVDKVDKRDYGSLVIQRDNLLLQQASLNVKLIEIQNIISEADKLGVIKKPTTGVITPFSTRFNQ